MAESEDNLYAMRHSAAHVLASAVKYLYKDVKFGVGPVIDNGFYYDFDLGEVVLSDDDLGKIEKEMAKIISEDQPIVKSVSSIDEAIAWAKENDQPYKLELLNSLKTSGTTDVKNIDPEVLGAEGESSMVDSVSFYTNGDFKDLCRGPHVSSTGKIGPFKLTRVSGAYWRGNEHNKQMQRVYGIAFDTREELDKYLENVEEAKKRDHRRLGQELDLFVFSDMVGSGLPMFTPKGTVLREELASYSNELRQALGYEKVWTPHMTKKELYEASGHWAKFGEELFLVESQETKDKMVLKPMNCPHHTRIYASQPRSYRDLPIRYLETATIYRDEKTGELAGLSRVRAVTQDDSHVFCRHDQIEKEIDSLLSAAKQLYATIDMKLRIRLSYSDDSDAYLGSKELWADAQKQLKNAVVANKLDYFEQDGEAAFYGPKIDFMATDAIGREHQVATIQLDFVQPERFGLEYTSEDSSKQTPVMIHCALLGSIERFLSVYIEHTAGRFPVWLAPEQIRIVTLNQTEEVESFASGMLEKAKAMGLRATIDNDNESVGKKIRQAEVMKVPYVVVIGSKEVGSNKVVPRIRQDLSNKTDIQERDIDEFLSKVKQEYSNRSIKSSL